MYFIESSVGRLYFKSDNLEEIMYRSRNDTYTPTHIEFVDARVLKKFLRLYDMEVITSATTRYGVFLFVQVSDGSYGTPEYKIYSE
jgi:hypothetical protein